MMDGVHDDGEEGGDYFFPLGVTQEAEGGGGGGRSSIPASVMMRD